MADTQTQHPIEQPATIQNPAEEKIKITVRNRTAILFDDFVTSVTSKNDTGEFDILPEHSNFISLITSPLILRKPDGQNKEIKFSSGIIKVKDNAVHCYIDLLGK